MASSDKKQKRAKRAKTKAKQARIARNNPQESTPIVPDYFMPDFSELDEEEDDLSLEDDVDPEILADMSDEEREAAIQLLAGDVGDMPTDDEMLLMELYIDPAPAPSDAQRLQHYETLRQAEQVSEQELLNTFVRGPVAAHALYNIDFEQYDDILVSTLGAYWVWAHGIGEQTARLRIANDDFYEAMRDALSDAVDEDILKHTSGGKNGSESSQD